MPSISPIRIIDDRALAYMPLFSNPAFQFHRTSCDNIFLSKNKCSLFECIFFVNIRFKIKKAIAVHALLIPYRQLLYSY